MDKFTYVVTLNEIIELYATVGIAAGLVVFGFFYGIFKLLGIIRAKRDKKEIKKSIKKRGATK